MIVQIYPDKDATIYENYSVMNTGLDSILELSKKAYYHNTISASIYTSRILMHFDMNDISALNTYTESFYSSSIDGTVRYYLNLYLATAKEIPTEYSISIYPVSESWTMGSGKFDYIKSNRQIDGVSWVYRSGVPVNTKWTTSSYAIDSTGSYNMVSGGGTWYNDTYATQSFEYTINDIRADVTDIVTAWLSGNRNNDGFILKLDNEYALDTNYDFSLQFFSRDSHTIFPPKLEICWDDSIYMTASLNYATQSISASKTTTQSGDYPTMPIISASGDIKWINSSSISYTSESTYSNETYNANYTLNAYSGTMDLSSFSGSFNGYYNGYINGTMLSQSLYSGSLYGAITAGTTVFYTASTAVSGTASIDTIFNGSFIGYLSASFSDLVLEGTYSASYDAIITGSITTQSVYIPSMRSVTTYYYSSSQTYYLTSSISRNPINIDNYVLHMSNMKQEYDKNSIQKFIVYGRDKYVEKTFATQSGYLVTKYLPSTSYYSIIDAHSNEVVTPFSDYTKVSCDSNKNYFNLIMDGYQTGRYYKLLFKIVSGSIEHYIDNNYIFKVVKEQ